MKQLVYFAVIAGLLAATGCKKQEDGSVETMTPEEIGNTAEQMAEQTQQIGMQAKEKATEVKAKAEAVTQEVAQKTEEAVAALNVKKEDVLADLDQSIEQVKKKVAAFEKTQLLAYMDQYKAVILEKKDEIAALTEQVKALPVTELMGDKAKELKSQLSQYSDQFSALKDRYSLYLDQLKEYGVDLSDYLL